MYCEAFACVYARKDGCSIKGYLSPEGPLNGPRVHCPHYDTMCINAKCRSCAHEGVGCMLDHVKGEVANG